MSGDGRGHSRAAEATPAGELGFLPLALEQAAAYIDHLQISPARYLDKLRIRPARMYAASAAGGDAERTIARLWDLHFEELQQRQPYALTLLRILHSPSSDNRRRLRGK